MNRRHSAAATILVSLVILAAPLVLYVTAYFGLCMMTYDWRNDTDGYYMQRLYTYEWLATAFEPAAWIESKVRGFPVETL